MVKDKKGFTLIELIAVFIIIAILALIVTPLVMSIIKKAKVSADKRSIDAYGRSIELAIAGYLMDTGTFPTSIEQLTIEYSGNEVVCSTTQINEDSSVYLAGCTVGGRSVEGYTYGKEETVTYDAYEIGDEVTYNNVAYRVIKNSDTTEEYLTLLKSEPLTVAEVNQYGGVGTANNHVNVYVNPENNLQNAYQTAINENGYGAMVYYTSETCGYINNNEVVDGCKSDYNNSDVKYVVDAWKAVQAPLASEARLITLDELKDNLGYEYNGSDFMSPDPTNTPSWVYSGTYSSYWTSIQYGDALDWNYVWSVIAYEIGEIDNNTPFLDSSTVRPVITISKSAL